MLSQNFMQSDYGKQGFLILLLASLMVVCVEAVRPDSSLWAESQSTDFQTQKDTLADFHRQVVERSPYLYGAESWEILPSEKEVFAKLESPFSRFFGALNLSQSRKSKVRIAYFGDSMIEGDLITQTLRHELQKMFGGNGVGFVPITSNTYSFRKSIWHRFSKDWRAYNFLKSNREDFGISGEIFLASQPTDGRKDLDTWVRYQGSNMYSTTQTFDRISLFYGRSDDSLTNQEPAFVELRVKDRRDTLFLEPKYAVNQLVLNEDPIENVELRFSIPKNLPIYGLNFESESGIHLDNFSSRGSSGQDLVEIPDEMMRQFHHHLEYDLVVLHFGVNVTSARRTNFDSYEAGMKKVIQHIRRCMPETDILMVSVGDRGIKLNGRWQTDPSVPLVLEAQRRVAKEMGVGFLDLYRSMGGKNTMVRWVARDWAIHDHVHTTRRGARKIAAILKDYLMSQYEEFEIEPMQAAR
ncbi:MAG: GDSL-type esterase/lipase family protein [Bacteroidota bacterium]